MALGIVAFGIVGWRLSRRVDEFLADRGPGPIRVYADSTVLRDGLNVEGAHLVARLRRLGYREVANRPREPGEFHPGRGRLEIALRAFNDPEGEHPARVVVLEQTSGIVQVVRDANGREIDYAVCSSTTTRAGCSPSGSLNARSAISSRARPGWNSPGSRGRFATSR